MGAGEWRPRLTPKERKARRAWAQWSAERAIHRLTREVEQLRNTQHIDTHAVSYSVGNSKWEKYGQWQWQQRAGWAGDTYADDGQWTDCPSHTTTSLATSLAQPQHALSLPAVKNDGAPTPGPHDISYSAGNSARERCEKDAQGETKHSWITAVAEATHEPNAVSYNDGAASHDSKVEPDVISNRTVADTYAKSGMAAVAETSHEPDAISYNDGAVSHDAKVEPDVISYPPVGDTHVTFGMAAAAETEHEPNAINYNDGRVSSDVKDEPDAISYRPEDGACVTLCMATVAQVKHEPNAISYNDGAASRDAEAGPGVISYRPEDGACEKSGKEAKAETKHEPNAISCNDGFRSRGTKVEPDAISYRTAEMTDSDIEAFLYERAVEQKEFEF